MNSYVRYINKIYKYNIYIYIENYKISTKHINFKHSTITTIQPNRTFKETVSGLSTIN